MDFDSRRAARAALRETGAPALVSDPLDSLHRRTFRSTLYRYWFWGWLLMPALNAGHVSASVGEMGRERSRWLMIYLRRWAGVGILGMVAQAVAQEHMPNWLQLIAWLPTALSAEMLALTGSVWVSWRFLR